MSLLRKFLVYTNLQSEMDDYEVIHAAIEKDIIFKGANLWVLVFAIFIASIGLNMNSTAVVIGAMLISPLMGPINGMGYSIATYNFPLFRRALKNFGFAVIASLFASTIYFSLSPVSTAHSELLARTSPTIYDVMIALFGGLAGIVAMSSRQKGNVIPGVAIATALMPPLCTAGYGLAKGEMSFFFGAFYLFTINTVFIAISSVIISRILKFPIRTIVEENQKKRVYRWTSLVILITLIPSIYFGYGLVQRERFTENANKFISDISVFEGSYLLKNEIDPTRKLITLIYGGSTLTQKSKEEILRRAAVFSLEGSKLIFKQGFSFGNNTTESVNQLDRMKSEINRLNLQLNEKDRITDSIISKEKLGRQILMEVKTIFPEIKSCSYAETKIYTDSLKNAQIKLVMMETNGKSLTNDDKKRINDWLKKRLQSENVKTFFQ